MTRRLITVALLAVSATVRAQAPEPITFKTGVRQSVLHGEKSERRDVAVTLTGDALILAPKSAEPVAIPFAAISSIVYDRRQEVVIYKGRGGTDHYLTVQYKLPNGTGDFAEMEMGKDVASKMVAVLEARSGKPITRTGK